MRRGIRHRGSIPVTPRTVFLAGSISKPVTAAGALAMVDAGTLSLNGDVSPDLKTWSIPSSPLTANQKVTLMRLLDHTSGITGGDFFPGYAIGTPIPSLLQILNGVMPAVNDRIIVTGVPCSQWSSATLIWSCSN